VREGREGEETQRREGLGRDGEMEGEGKGRGWGKNDIGGATGKGERCWTTTLVTNQKTRVTTHKLFPRLALTGTSTCHPSLLAPHISAKGRINQ
jgi:hypothetical protein